MVTIGAIHTVTDDNYDVTKPDCPKFEDIETKARTISLTEVAIVKSLLEEEATDSK